VSAGQSVSPSTSCWFVCEFLMGAFVSCVVLPRFSLNYFFIPLDGCAVRWFIWNSVGATESQVPTGGGKKFTKNRDKENIKKKRI
jgi:hypothetical protein